MAGVWTTLTNNVGHSATVFVFNMLSGRPETQVSSWFWDFHSFQLVPVWDLGFCRTFQPSISCFTEGSQCACFVPTLYRLLKNGYLADPGRKEERSAKETDFKSA